MSALKIRSNEIPLGTLTVVTEAATARWYAAATAGEASGSAAAARTPAVV